jgi:hypothetical protein
MASPAPRSSSRSSLWKVLLLYAVLAAIVFVASGYFPWLREALMPGEAMSPEGLADSIRAGSFPVTTEAQSLTEALNDPERVFALAIAAMAMSFLLMLPVTFVFTATRAKRGYRQAMVQTLLILPVVVAGVVILVKNNVALAFSLGGIVGAISFRQRLEDPKDAVYIFLGIAVGLACGVQVYGIGLALSFFFNAVILVLWYTDFGRVPGQLDEAIAQRRIERAREMVSPQQKRGGEFVSVIDQQVLRSMTPEQLGALAERAIEHRKKMVKDVLDVPERDRLDTTLRLVLPSDAIDTVRTSVEAVLFRDAKDFRFDKSTPQDGDKVTLEYKVRLRKKVPQPLLLEAVRRAALPHAEQVALE